MEERTPPTPEVSQTAADDPAPGPGHNNPPTTFDERKARTDEILAAANAWKAQCAAIESEAQAAKAADLLALIREAAKINEEERKKEGQPFRDSLDAINGRYKTLASLLDLASAALKGLLQPWLTKKQRDQEAAAKAAKAEADRLAKEAADRLASATTIQDQFAAGQALEASRKALEKGKAIAGTSAGVKGEVAPRATGLRERWVATEITDRDAAIQQYRDHEEMTALLLRLANADVRNNKRRRIPGFKIETVASVG